MRTQQRHVDPVLDRMEEEASRFADVAATGSKNVSGLWERWQRWLDTWRPKNKRRY